MADQTRLGDHPAAAMISGSTPEPPSEDLPSLDERVVYRCDDVIVTDRWLAVQGRRYLVRDLQDIRIIRTQHSELTIGSAVATGVVIFAVARLWDRLDVDGWIGAVTVLAVPMVLTLLGMRRSGFHLMMARVYGCWTLVLSDVDRRRLGRVARAVRSAQAGD